MRTQTRVVALGVQLPIIEVRVVLHREAESCCRMLDAHFSLNDVVGDLRRFLICFQITGLYPFGTTPSATQQPRLEVCRLGRGCRLTLVVSHRHLPEVACGRFQGQATQGNANRLRALHDPRVIDNTLTVNIRCEHELIRGLNNTTLIGMQLPGELQSGKINATWVTQRLHSQVVNSQRKRAGSKRQSKQRAQKKSLEHRHYSLK